MTKAGWAFVLTASLALPGCYDFASPLDATPQLQRDGALLGEWRCLSAEPKTSEEAGTVVFSPVREREYVVALTEDGKAADYMSGYASAVSGGTILNLREQDPEKLHASWTLVRYSFLLPNVVRFEVVDDDPFQETQGSPEALRSALERLSGQPGLYEDLCICVRVAKGSPQ